MLILIGYLAVKEANTAGIYSALRAGLIVLGITDCIAIYEVFDQCSWASTLESSGAMVYRASSLFSIPIYLVSGRPWFISLGPMACTPARSIEK